MYICTNINDSTVVLNKNFEKHLLFLGHLSAHVPPCASDLNMFPPVPSLTL